MIKRNIYILWGIALLQGMVFYAPVATLYRQAAGLGIFHITLIESISLVLMICMEVPWGWAADRIGYKRTMLICCALYFLSKIVFWKADGFSDFLLERLMLSVVCAGLSGVDSSMLYLSCGKADSHRVFSIYQTMGELGMLLAAFCYALWIQENYRRAALLTVLTYGAAAILALGLQEVSPKEKTKAVGGNLLTVLKLQLRNKKNLLLLMAVALLGETHQTVTVFLSQLQYIRAGMGHRAISFSYIAVSVVGLIGGLSAGVCARLGAKKMGRMLFGIATISCMILAGTELPLLSVLAVLALRAAFALMMPLKATLENKLVTAEDRATALSVNAVMQDGLGIFLNLMLGYVAEVSLPAAMTMAAGLCLIGVFAYHTSSCFE